MSGVVIRGDGIAAFCCVHLLRQAGIAVSFERIERRRLPVIMLGTAALTLLKDVFGSLQGFGEAPRIDRRVVAWGENAEAVSVDHAALVVSEQLLLDNLHRTIASGESVSANAPDWTIFAAPPLPRATIEHRFGTRSATATPVTLRKPDPGSCWSESLPNGWLFLIPSGGATGYLLAVGAPPQLLLEDSLLIAKQIASPGPIAGDFPAHPRLQWPLCDSGWLACGTAAMAFDPLCGDGTAHAIREAILAAAVVQSILKGGDERQLLAHYQARLAAGFSRHLMLCDQFYRTGHRGPWWQLELDAMRQGVAWCSRQFKNAAEFHYQLDGFELRPVA